MEKPITDKTLSTKTEKSPIKILLRAVFFGVVGGIIGYVSAKIALNYFSPDLLDYMKATYGLPHFFGFLLSLFFTGIAIILFFVTFNKNMLAKTISPDGDADEKEMKENATILRWTGLGWLAYSAIIFAVSFGLVTEQYWPPILFVGAMIAVILGVNLFLWAKYDELYRVVTKDTAALTYTILECVILIWAAAAIFVPGIVFRPLDVVLVMMSIYLLSAIIVAFKRGTITAFG